jgi:predicted restriction endonuclease
MLALHAKDPSSILGASTRSNNLESVEFYWIRRYLFEKYNSKCQRCGWGEVNSFTKLVPLQVHHIDGNCINNNEDNLQLLCPNCHSLTDTYGSLNANSSRAYRRQK